MLGHKFKCQLGGIQEWDNREHCVKYASTRLFCDPCFCTSGQNRRPCPCTRIHGLLERCPNTEFFSGPYLDTFPHSDGVRENPYFEIFRVL